MRGMKGLVYETSVLDPDEVSHCQSLTTELTNHIEQLVHRAFQTMY